MPSNKLARFIDRFYLNSYQYYDIFNKSQWWKKEELKLYQLRSIKKLAEKIKLKINSWDDFNSIPFTNKNDLRNYKPSKHTQYHIHNTSGSTGYPLSIYISHQNWGMKEAMFLRHWEWMGRKNNELVVRWISGEPQFPIFDRLRNVKPFNFRNLDDKKLDWIVKNKPQYIHSTVFTARQIVHKLKERNQLQILKNMKLWWTNENTEPHIDEMKEYFKKIFHGYGLAELTPVATQCEVGNLHVIMEMAIVEDYKGEIVVTNPFNEVMPIIRYRTGDRGKIIPSNCSCGRELDIIVDLNGKGVDYYSGPEFKIPLDWLIVSPISKRYIEYIDTWRAEVDINKKLLTLYVKWKNINRQSQLNWYNLWLLNEVGLNLNIITHDGKFPDKQLLRILR